MFGKQMFGKWPNQKCFVIANGEMDKFGTIIINRTFCLVIKDDLLNFILPNIPIIWYIANI